MNNLKILLVEDSRVFSRLVLSLLDVSEDYSFTVDTAETLKDAFEHLHQKHYDAVILDLTLPDSSPEHTFDSISILIPETPIIVSTSSGNNWALNALRKGAQDYLPKSGLTSDIICKAIGYGIERKKLLLEAIERETALKQQLQSLTQKLESTERELKRYQTFSPQNEAKKDAMSHFEGKSEKPKQLGSVLVVDDIDVNLTIASRLLNKCGIENVEVARNGVEAFEKWEHEHYEVIFMDIHMPIMDGITATAKIRNSKSGNTQPHILALSASLTDSVVSTCIHSGVDKILSKPITISKLQEALAELVA